MEPRADRERGTYVGFVLRRGNERLKVVAVGALADAVLPFLPGLVGQRVSLWGRVEMVPWRKGDRDMPPYKRLQLARIKTDEWVMPAVPSEPISDEQAAILERERAEADSVAMGL
jgi:hypothetical protein